MTASIKLDKQFSDAVVFDVASTQPVDYLRLFRAHSAFEDNFVEDC